MKSTRPSFLRTRHLFATLLTTPLLFASLQATAQDTSPALSACDASYSEGAFQADFSIGEYYPGSELHRQTVTLTAIPAEIPNDPPSIKTRPPKYEALLSMTSKSSLKDKALLKKGEFETLAFTLTLPLLETKMWYHNKCLSETEDYVLLDNIDMEASHTNHCDLNLYDAQRKVLNKGKTLDYSFSGHEHWQPFKLRFDLVQLRAFQEKVDALSAQQVTDFSTGKCGLKPFTAHS